MGQIVTAMATVHAPQLFTRPPSEDPAQLDADILAWQSSLKPDPRFLRDLCEVRLAIEPIAAGFAALRATQEEIANIRECLGRRLQVVAADDLEGAVEADLQYHGAVIAASHNPLFLQLNTTMRDPFRVELSYTLLLPASVALELEEYRKLTEAIEARNPRLRPRQLCCDSAITDRFGAFRARERSIHRRAATACREV